MPRSSAPAPAPAAPHRRIMRSGSPPVRQLCARRSSASRANVNGPQFREEPWIGHGYMAPCAPTRQLLIRNGRHRHAAASASNSASASSVKSSSWSTITTLDRFNTTLARCLLGDGGNHIEQRGLDPVHGVCPAPDPAPPCRYCACRCASVTCMLELATTAQEFLIRQDRRAGWSVRPRPPAAAPRCWRIQPW